MDECFLTGQKIKDIVIILILENGIISNISYDWEKINNLLDTCDLSHVKI